MAKVPTDVKQPTKEPTVTDEQLNAAADLLLTQLPDHAGELVHILQGEYQVQLWHLLCGIMLAMHQEGRLSAFTLDPAWRDGLRQRMLKCHECNKLFKPHNIGQQFCTNTCGNINEARKLGLYEKDTQNDTYTDSVSNKPESVDSEPSPNNVDPVIATDGTGNWVEAGSLLLDS